MIIINDFLGSRIKNIGIYEDDKWSYRQLYAQDCINMNDSLGDLG
jgi:hypothetical protein